MIDILEPLIPYNKLSLFATQVETQFASIVLVGGCFDLLHVGHVTFLEKARSLGDCLVVLLESDERITKLKGKHRPINTQSDRARVLLALKSVDYCILLPASMHDRDYDALVKRVKPAIIATTKNDPQLHHKMRQAASVSAKVICVVDHLPEHSTTQKAEQLRKHTL